MTWLYITHATPEQALIQLLREQNENLPAQKDQDCRNMSKFAHGITTVGTIYLLIVASARPPPPSSWTMEAGPGFALGTTKRQHPHRAACEGLKEAVPNPNTVLERRLWASWQEAMTRDWTAGQSWDVMKSPRDKPDAVSQRQSMKKTSREKREHWFSCVRQMKERLFCYRIPADTEQIWEHDVRNIDEAIRALLHWRLSFFKWVNHVQAMQTRSVVLC